MTLSLYNTLTRRVEPFQPLHPPRVTLYTCGPTVWNYAHIGNFRTFLFEDLLRRYLEFSEYEVFHIMNLTDVDDRTIKAAAAVGKRLADHTVPYAQAFFEDRDYLRIKPAHVYPRATQSVPAMVALVQNLLDKGVAYIGEDGSVYFAINKFPRYGQLSQLDRRELKVGARVASDEYAKDDPRDFALWKKVSPQDEQVGAVWDAPFGRGRPGWHLECSAMSLSEIDKYFRENKPDLKVQTLDIHAGGVDLIFPHHEDEIAQSEAATGEPFARYWLHGAFLNVKGTKMSKRFGNSLTARDLREEGVDASAVRLMMFSTHYRQELDFSDETLGAAREGSRRLGKFRERLFEVETPPSHSQEGEFPSMARRLRERFTAALDADLNAPEALAALFDFVREGNRLMDQGLKPGMEALAIWQRLEPVLDVSPPVLVPHNFAFEQWVTQQIEARDKARQGKDFSTADRIREALRARGVELEDTPTGTKWRVV